MANIQVSFEIPDHAKEVIDNYNLAEGRIMTAWVRAQVLKEIDRIKAEQAEGGK